MIRLVNSLFTLLVCLALAGLVCRAQAAPATATESILQHGFPAQTDALAKITQALFQEYVSDNNVVSLIFYSCGMLLQAQHFATSHDYINAAEYSRTAFFYLDEAAETHEDNPRVHYLRARIDAWLPARFGRCVITLADTAALRDKLPALSAPVLSRIAMMRYRALNSCNKHAQAEQLAKRLMQQGNDRQLFNLDSDSAAPDWDMHEVNEIIMPLLKDN